MERSPKLISDNIDQVSPLIALLSLKKTEPEPESASWRHSRLYGLEYFSSSLHDGIRDLTERMDKDEDVVLIEAQSVSLEHEMMLEVVLDVRSAALHKEESLVSLDESGFSLISSRSCTATSLFDSEIFSHIFLTSSCSCERMTKWT